MRPAGRQRQLLDRGTVGVRGQDQQGGQVGGFGLASRWLRDGLLAPV